METRRPEIKLEHSKVNNRITAEKRKLIREEQDKIALACKDNSKKFWQFVQEKTKHTSNIGNLKWKDNSSTELCAENDLEKALEDFSHRSSPLKITLTLKSCLINILMNQ